VPSESVVRSGREAFCYVKVGKGLEERRVTTGGRNDRQVEIKDGPRLGATTEILPAEGRSVVETLERVAG
jgi:hypothetical protein